MVVVLDKAHVKQAKQLLEAAGETAYEIGIIRAQANGEAPTVVI